MTRTPLVALLLALLGGAAGQAHFTLSSPDFAANRALPARFAFNANGCTGQNTSPELHWTALPNRTQALALIVHDPDAKAPGGWYHWLVVNLPASQRMLPRDAGQKNGPALPPGTLQTATSFGQPGYGGPCPPVGSGAHHYHFTLYALKAPLTVAATDKPDQVEAAAKAASLGMAELIGTFER